MSDEAERLRRWCAGNTDRMIAVMLVRDELEYELQRRDSQWAADQVTGMFDRLDAELKQLKE